MKYLMVGLAAQNSPLRRMVWRARFLLVLSLCCGLGAAVSVVVESAAKGSLAKESHGRNAWSSAASDNPDDKNKDDKNKKDGKVKKEKKDKKGKKRETADNDQAAQPAKAASIQKDQTKSSANAKPDAAAAPAPTATSNQTQATSVPTTVTTGEPVNATVPAAPPTGVNEQAPVKVPPFEPPQPEVLAGPTGAGKTATVPSAAEAGKTMPGDTKSGKDKAEEDVETFRISSNLVTVPVSVTDASGEPLRNLRAEDFRLDEEGHTQQLQSLGAPGETPLELVLLFDVSGSVYERLEFEKQAASRFLRQILKPNDTLSVFLVGMQSRPMVKRTRQFPATIETILKLESTKEGTAFFDTVAQAAQFLHDQAEPGARRVIIVISDGEDNQSQSFQLNEVKRELQRSETIFYAINPSGPSIKLNHISTRGHDGMKALAMETGGVAFLPDRIEDLDRVFRQIQAELEAQYLLGYYSTNEANDGKYRRIRIQVPKRPEIRIRARQGYYAPKDN